MLQHVRSLVYLAPLFFLLVSSCQSTPDEGKSTTTKVAVTLPSGLPENGYAYGALKLVGVPGTNYNLLTDGVFSGADFEAIRSNIEAVYEVPGYGPNASVLSINYNSAIVSTTATSAGQSDTSYLAFKLIGNEELVYFKMTSYILWGDMNHDGFITTADWNGIRIWYLFCVGDVGPYGQIVTAEDLLYLDRSHDNCVSQIDLTTGDNESPDVREHSILKQLNDYAAAHPHP